MPSIYIKRPNIPSRFSLPIIQQDKKFLPSTPKDQAFLPKIEFHYITRQEMLPSTRKYQKCLPKIVFQLYNKIINAFDPYGYHWPPTYSTGSKKSFPFW
jgi:hypothetical protein